MTTDRVYYTVQCLPSLIGALDLIPTTYPTPSMHSLMVVEIRGGQGVDRTTLLLMALGSVLASSSFW